MPRAVIFDLNGSLGGECIFVGYLNICKTYVRLMLLHTPSMLPSVLCYAVTHEKLGQ